MPKNNFTYKVNEAENSADIHIYGVIGYDDSYWDEGTNNVAYALVSLIKRLEKTNKRINVHINSPGGAINDGLAIYNTLKSSGAEVHTYNSGFVGSMASIIMLAGTTHFPTTSIYHLHRASTEVRGNVNELQKEIAALETYESALIQAISEKTGMSVEDITAKWFDGGEHYMTATQAQEFGFVDVLENTVANPPAAMNVLQSLKYAAVVNMFQDEDSDNNTNEKGPFLQRLLRKMAPQHSNISPKNHTQMRTLKSGVIALIAILASNGLKLNDSNDVELSLDDALKLNNEFEKLQTKANKAELQIEALKEDVAKRDAEISELKAKIEGILVPDNNSPKNDQAPDDTTPSLKLDDDVKTKLRNYLKKK
jgi:ATP-dependent Clp endopeptidase proteolytic subunit ClpP